jgi:hypothetical protein
MSTRVRAGSPGASADGRHPPPRPAEYLKLVLAVAKSLYDRGFWIVPIRAKGEVIRRKNPRFGKDPDAPEFLEKTCKGKEPMGFAWGAKRWRWADIERTIRAVAGRGFGIVLGPGRAPDGKWLINAEGDGDQAEASWLALCNGEVVETMGHRSRRGIHRFLVADGDRLLELLRKAGGKADKDRPGVWHLAELPGLELRVGGVNAKGATLQIQSVGAPCLGEDDLPREPLACATLAELPAPSYAWLATREKPRDLTAYGQKALAEEAAEFASKQPGERHGFLLESSNRLASLVKAGALSEEQALAEYRAGAVANGMDAEGRSAEVGEIWASAMARVEPRDIKDTGFRPPANGSANGHADSVHSVQCVQEPRAWEAITLGQVPAVKPFPIHAFPEPIRKLCNAVALSIGCPVDVVGGMILGTASTAIGRSVSLMLKPGYFVNASLWLAVIGPVSEGKSPALEIVGRPIYDIDDALREEYLLAKGRWDIECALAKRSKQPPPPPPVRKTLCVDDITIEALTQIESDNPRGVGWFCDELTACVLGLNQYKAGGRGNDRPTLMKMQAGKRFKRNRKGEESLGPFSYVTIFGGMVPSMLSELRDAKGRVDGFLDRFHPIFPETGPISAWTTVGVPEATMEAWAKIVRRLYEQAMDVDAATGRHHPRVIRLAPDAEARFIELYNRHVAEMNDPAFDPELRGAWGKYRESAAKFALNLACLRDACNPDTYGSKRFQSINNIYISSIL